ncbi:PQQ-dependent sugar dehydrogenase [Halomonas eurihalina]|uniref:PQQ-dependent sugar dehydrogenase n=1 Tax=Halomonas eurihalina TaxID=42566 RepID=A0A5D9DCV4_HALER|nr:PQQ-dependent sugar dehydrogenase [Halomonas eurihalina]MDR5857866.1 PQQ-dependent sugar dehydrogenase [Halomonas eurihalina]TZG41616.1 PQQ-dependent sugar dehydrogenase [Halomonas eurihalina]
MRHTPLLPTMLLGTTTLFFGPAQADDPRIERLTTAHHELRLERLATGLEHPWAVTEMPDGRYLISERPGRLQLVTPEGEKTRVTGVPEVSTRGQGGLLDVALHPRFGSDEHGDGEHDWVYFTWSRAGDDGTATSLSRARLVDEHLEEVEHLFTQDRFSAPGRHYGSRLAWLDDGTLLMSIGDRGVDPERAQDGSDHAGSLLRLTDEGKAPGDNPFVDDPDINDEIFSLGNRNPQGLVVTEDGTPWSTEHGPRTGDELNRIVAGDNYGWPQVTQGRDYATNMPLGEDSAPGMRDPVHVFAGRFAPSGLTDVTGEAFPGWRGNLLAGGLASEKLVRLALEGDNVTAREVVLDGEIGRIRDIRQARDGSLLLLNDASDAGLYRLTRSD